MAEVSRSRVPVKLDSAGDTHIGGRTHNEDAILLRPDLNLYVVADGAGGQNAGNVAASLATTSIAHFFEQITPGLERLPEYDKLGLYTAARKLSISVQEANKEILEIAKTSDRHHGMGTTVVASLFVPEQRRVHVAQVGDSRFYRLREGRLELLTHDHSLANDVLEMRPEIEDARLASLPQNVITRALGMSDKLRVALRTYDLAHNDRFLICSDGLSDVVDELQMSEVLALDSHCDDRVRLLIDLALEEGADDNVAVIVLDCMLAAKGAVATARKKQPTPVAAKRPRTPVFRSGPSRDSISDESVPEIVLFDDDADASSPMIHVVPLDSASDAVVDAVSDVFPKRRGGTSSRANEQAPHQVPDMRPARPTMAYSAFERGGAAAGASVSVPRRNKDEFEIDDAPSRTGDTAHPPGPEVAEITSRNAAAPPPASDDDDDDDGSPTAVRDSSPGKAPPRITRPGAGAPRPRATQEGPPPPLPASGGKKGRLNLPAARGARSKVPAPKSQKPKIPAKAGAPTRPKAPTPPPRDLLDTNEFIGEETVACHACGSFISKRAEICLYCGAPTGFVIKDRGSKP